MMIVKTTESCGRHIAGFQCDSCKKTEITGDFPANWFRDDNEMLCPGCVYEAYAAKKAENVEYQLSMKRIEDILAKTKEDIYDFKRVMKFLYE